MLRALRLAVADVGNRRVLAIMLQAIAISLLLFVLLGGGLVWLFSGADPCHLAGLGACPADTATGTLGAIGLTLVAAWLLFPAVAITVIATFTDRIATAVEEAHYPEAARNARAIGLWSGGLLGLKSAGRLLAFNLLALPFYLFLLATGIGPIVLFVVVNGVAFGRDVAELAAARHGDTSSRRAWLKDSRGQQHLIGVAASILFLFPLANLLAPVVGTAAGIHLFNLTFWKTNRRHG